MRNHGLFDSSLVIVSRCPKYPRQPRWPSPAQGSYGWQSPGPQPPCWKSGTPCQNPSLTCQTTIASFTWPVSSSAGPCLLVRLLCPSPLATGHGVGVGGGQSVDLGYRPASSRFALPPLLHLLPRLHTSCPDTCRPFTVWPIQAPLGAGRGDHSPGAELRGLVAGLGLLARASGCRRARWGARPDANPRARLRSKGSFKVAPT